MTLSPGAQLGPYEILAPIGAGGMGEVYKARDSRLDRVVAIKILPESLAGDPQFRERFNREARAISQLSHPHICTLFDVGEQQGTAFLVMEYLEGMTLADRLAKGPLPIDHALKISVEVTSALDQAHRAGIVHRDLKPGNILLTKSGAKLLDFGLAKNGPVTSGASQTTMAIAPNLTAQGTILGTLQYMAPEQLEGREADTRTDLFAFGAVLYEMLAGRKAFDGQTSANVIGAILKEDPPLVSQLRSPLPAPLDRIVRKCLQKDRDARWQSAHDLHDELSWIATDSAPVAAAHLTPSSPWREQAGWIAALAVAVLSVTLWVLASRARNSSSPNAPPMRLEIATPVGASLPGFAISPDRRALVYQATTDGHGQLWLRLLDSDTAQPLAGTEGATGVAPFWSPDSRSIGFFTANQLKRIDLDGGVRTLASASAARGATWGTEGTILFAAGSAGSISAVSANGVGEVSAATRVERPRQSGHRFPHFLPDGRHFLFYALGDEQGRGVYLGTLGSMDARRLLDAASAAVFSSPDQVFFAREGGLWAQALDLQSAQLRGEPSAVSSRLALNGDLFGDVALAETAPGMIAYRASAGKRQLRWFDRSGQPIGAWGDPDEGQISSPRLSPDGRTVAFRRTLNGNTDIWYLEVGRNAPRRLTSNPARDYDLAWGPLGSDRILFSSDRKGMLDLYETTLGRSGAAETLVLDTPEHKNTCDWSADGRYILYSVQSATTGNYLWMLPLFGDRRPRPIAQTPQTEANARLSPDGHWVAYESNESGRFEIYVQSFPDLVRKQQISLEGGFDVGWRSDSRELFFRSLNDRLMSARVPSSGSWLDPVTPSALFALPQGAYRVNTSSSYAPSPDGSRFLVNMSVESVPPITVLLNWKPKR